MPNLPTKTRDIHNHHIDSTVWDDIHFRDDDIIIGTYGKSGTTWMQQIVSQLIFEGEENLPVSEMSHWVDLRIPPKEVKLPMIEAQTHRRFLKTHLPVDALVFSEKAKYIYVARDGRDIAWSMHNHHACANDAWYDALNNTPGRVGPPITPPIGTTQDYFENWLDNDGTPFWPFWENVRSWWAIRNLPNVMLVHFADLKSDMEGQIRRIAEFIDVPAEQAVMDRVLEHCSFDYMKANAAQTVPLGGAFWEGGAKTFIHKGNNGRWKDELPQSVSDRYEQVAVTELGETCANWLKNGGS
ncbi:sulfotransferase [Sulfitobacter sp. SK012]|uniref:sulfotransferase domain-containing protein n=1 Tax=Sulfitobacter sp. SK012 TaxID=1389005 RepID=UPI000E0A0A3C|nr:sulfotransferase domain-containing protein [Sulfitobacter sp. SK012]AXI48063.1 sulfotransferase [Sulfitobacter sp. SK012]